MRFPDTLHSALKGVTVNTLRSVLTMLGIIIGVGSVVLMTAIGASVQRVILSQVSTLGARSMIIVPGKDQGGGPQSLVTGSLVFPDVEALEKLQTIETVAPVMFVSGVVRYVREQASPQILGTKENFFRNQNITVARGRLLDRFDEDGARSVAVLGPDTATDLFGNADPLGRRIQVADHSFTVVGILAPVGTQFFQSIDERVYLPLSIAKILTGQNHLNFITLRAVRSIDLAKADIASLLRQRHRIRSPQDEPDKHDDFHVHSSEQATQILSTVSIALTIFLTAIAGISLLVGGIGIMNIMLVAVTERTREIGLRKAVGARRRDILLQFLIEAVLLTLLGGLIGIALGIGSAALISLIAKRFLPSYGFAISFPAIGIAIAVAAAVGLIFGLYPARRAAGLSPMEALRYE